LKGVEIDLTGSRDGARESSANGRESKRQLTSRTLRLVDEGDIEGEEGIDVVVGCASDETGVLRSVASVRGSLFDGDDQVGE
jgi:hypothetical protein